MVIWITGAGSGLGRELARQYAALGHEVAVSARTSENLQSLARECEAMPGNIHAYPCDVTVLDSVKYAFHWITDDIGVPDKVIFNAGTHIPSPLDQFDHKIHRSLMEVNYMGVVNGLETVLPQLRERGSGQIILVASLAAYRGLPYAGAYGASKAALINLAESLKPEMERSGLDLRLVNPGFVRTQLTDLNEFDMPFLMEVDQAAHAMIRGLEGSRFEIVFPRRLGIVMSLLKGLPDRFFFALGRQMLRKEQD
ncbi:SDR family NAD(P)-dependent oxidoreductase [Emcibacter sp.]|uniref:SDR family NAD(P)-dependent oxidoreductase n=1 Tax=Emcibacter sp. TaxID=1979954 RepID=UPI002AA75DDD|nr:SDR family NAD(P)-dependent oxidoreductase [Emcibacter sp.]